MPTALFFRPNTDLALSYGRFWLSLGVQEAVKRGYKVIDLVDEACTFETLKQSLETEKVDVGILLGHGGSDIFTGYEKQEIFRVCTGDEIMNGTITHFVSCLIGQQLLPDLIEKGAVWTVGYQDTFNFIVDTSFPVESDPLAEPFKDLTLAIVTALLDGKKLKDVWDVGIAKCDEWIAKLWDRPETEWGDVISCLQHDRDCMIGLGDGEAYVMPPMMVAGIPSFLLPLAVGGAIAWWALK